MKVSKRVGFIITSAMVLTMGIPAISSAGINTGTEEFEVSIELADLDLSNDAGVKSLYNRLKTAANRACGVTTLTEAGSIERVMDNKQCSDEALTRAVAKVDNDKLSALHRS